MVGAQQMLSREMGKPYEETYREACLMMAKGRGQVSNQTVTRCGDKWAASPLRSLAHVQSRVWLNENLNNVDLSISIQRSLVMDTTCWGVVERHHLPPCPGSSCALEKVGMQPPRCFFPCRRDSFMQAWGEMFWSYIAEDQ